MNNWYYNEIEMIGKHKMLKEAGRRQRQARQAQQKGGQGLARALLLALGRSLVSAGSSLLRRYEPPAEGPVLAETDQ